MKRYLIVTALASILAGIAAYAAPAGNASTETSRVYAEAQWLIRAERVHVPWDGGYERATAHGFCIETFNGSAHAMRQYGARLAPGFYLKICEDGSYFVNDGVPFHRMRAY